MAGGWGQGREKVCELRLEGNPGWLTMETGERDLDRREVELGKMEKRNPAHSARPVLLFPPPLLGAL